MGLKLFYPDEFNEINSISTIHSYGMGINLIKILFYNKF